MPVKKVFTDEDNELEVFINDNGYCAISIEMDVGFATLIELDTEDLGELICELQYIKKQMEANA